MATRQELQVGNDAVRFTIKVNELLWLGAYYAQGVNARTGEPFLIDDKEPTSEEILEKFNGKMVAADRVAKNINLYLSDSKRKESVTKGLLGNVVIKDIEDDCNTGESAYQYVQVQTTISYDKNKLTSIGEYIEALPNKVMTPTPTLPDEIRFPNIANDTMDAMYYALKRINYGQGGAVDWSLDKIKAMVLAWCVALDRTPAYQTSDPVIVAEMDSLYQVKEVVQNQIREIDSFASAGELADYIGATVPKLPLIRRVWAHG